MIVSWSGEYPINRILQKILADSVRRYYQNQGFDLVKDFDIHARHDWQGAVLEMRL